MIELSTASYSFDSCPSIFFVVVILSLSVPMSLVVVFKYSWMLFLRSADAALAWIRSSTVPMYLSACCVALSPRLTEFSAQCFMRFFCSVKFVSPTWFGSSDRSNSSRRAAMS